MNKEEFEACLTALRPRLNRYCARMTGSAFNGEDVVQETLIKALLAYGQGVKIDHLDGWVFRIARNASLDFLREKSRANVVPLSDELEAEALPDSDIVAISFQTFLRLPELQRCAVILKDVLGHSIDEIASIAECSPTAAKSALQRGRAALRQLMKAPPDIRLPLMSDVQRSKTAIFVHLFQGGDFDTIRAMLADDVKLELVNRLHWEGREKIAPYFTRYAQETKWRFAFGAVEGQPAMLVFDAAGDMEKPAHFVLVNWAGNQIAEIRDYLFAPYVLEAIDWVRLE